MRVIVIKESTDLQSLGTRLVGKKTGGTAALEQVQALNPHVDFTKIAAGTVLLLPDSPELKTDADKDTRSPAGDAFDGFAKDADAGVKLAAQRLRVAADALNADRAGISAAVKTAAVKRLIEADPLLKKQLDDAGTAWTAGQKASQDAAKQLEVLQKMLGNELAVLAASLR